MSKIHTDNSHSIGNTPLVTLQRIATNQQVLVKIESRNPSFSIKCRVGANLIWDAEKRGLLKAGIEIIEPTSGNTGIALAYTAAARGYKLTLTMPANMSIERQKILKGLGANLILTDPKFGMQGAIDKAAAIMHASPNKYYMPQQFENPANPEIHYKTTGPEIWQDSAGKVDVLVATVGTGGTISGIGKYLKEQKDIKVIAVEPKGSPVITQSLNNAPLKPGPHKIQGIGAGFIPKNLDLSIIDEVITVEDNEAITMAQRLMREEGIIAGISSGAALSAAIKLCNNDQYKDKKIVVILPDTGERYLSTPLFD